MVFVDSHVHIHNCFNPRGFLDASWQNMTAACRRLTGDKKRLQAVLMLTEEAGVNWFDALLRQVVKKTDALGDWQVHPLGEECSLRLQNSTAGCITLIAGRQVQTQEGLEVLALGVRRQFEDCRGINATIRQVKDAGGIPVIPWGFGKWIGKRGKVIDRLIRDAEEGDLFIGDNSGRPRILAEPPQFAASRRKGFKILSGSDPLPFAREYRRAGSYGFCFSGALSEDKPAGDLKQRLADPRFTLTAYGASEKLGRFIHNQLLMQVKKRLGKSLAKVT